MERVGQHGGGQQAHQHSAQAHLHHGKAEVPQGGPAPAGGALEDHLVVDGKVVGGAEHAGQHGGPGDVAQAAGGEEHLAEDPEQHQIQHAGGKAGKQEFAEDRIDADGIPHRMEMACGIVVDVDGLDGHLADAHPGLLGVDEHVALELVALALGAQQLGHEAGGHGAQPGLGVADGQADQGLEHGAGALVAKAAAGGHVRGVKVPAAQDQVVGELGQRLGTVQDALGRVLAVRVGGDAAGGLGPGEQAVVERVLQGAALAQVHRVAQHMAAQPPGRIVKDRAVSVPAAVIDQHDVLHIGGPQLFQQGGQLFVGLQRRDHHRDLFVILHEILLQKPGQRAMIASIVLSRMPALTTAKAAVRPLPASLCQSGPRPGRRASSRAGRAGRKYRPCSP